MIDLTKNLPNFCFEKNTVGTLRNRRITFIRRAVGGYLVEFLPSPETANIPQVMIGTRPDIEFEGRRVIPHEELTAALMDGTLDIDEGDFVFIDHSQTFKPEFVASISERPAQDLILRYSTVMLMREICTEKGIPKNTRSAVAAIEHEILQRLPARIKDLNFKVDKLRRHPMRRHKVPENTATAQRILEWDERLKTKGFASLVDRRYLSGNHLSKLHPIVGQIIGEVLDERVSLEKSSPKHIHGAISRRVDEEHITRKAHLLEREQSGEVVSLDEHKDLERIVAPSMRTVKSWIDRTAPIESMFRKEGPDWLLRNQLISGEGIKAERAGQVVMIDEYDIDLMSIVPYEFLLHWLGHTKLEELNITGDKAIRVVLSVTIDAYTGCILGLQIGKTATPELAKRTIMMSMMDKTAIGEAAGAHGKWNQFLRPEKLMHDSGNAYIAYVTEALCAQLRIDKIAAPKAKPYIRGLMERIFRTIHSCLLEAIPGKTFSNTVLRGEYNSEAEAVLSLDDLIQVLTIWIVDIYHNNPNLGRDGSTPSELWNHEMTVGKGCRPVPDLKTMSHVFGTTLTRQAQHTGIRIMHANYFSNEFAGHLLRNPTRHFRVRWWEENMSEVQVEIRPDAWLPLEVMDERARGLSVDEWMRVLEKAHIDRDPEAAKNRGRAQGQIDDLVQDRIALRRKVARKTFSTEVDVTRLEEQMLRYFVTPTTRITSDQTHGLYGAPVSSKSRDLDAAVADDATSPSSADGGETGSRSKGLQSADQPYRKTVKGRRKTTTWIPGSME